MIDRESAIRAIEARADDIRRLMDNFTAPYATPVIDGLRDAMRIIRALPDALGPPTPCPLDLIDIDGETE